MDQVKTLRDYGLFDAKVPRYTSFPPANRFESELGHRFQANWLQGLPPSKPVSLYVHIPFCRRLCWFCACRTQGTRTLAPVEAYLNDITTEIEAVRGLIPPGTAMARLHLGGGTPTLLSAKQMRRLVTAIFNAFPRTENFEFSVEIDPTEAAPPVLQELADLGLDRASIGVQDFEDTVQATIGRLQSYEETARVIDQLRTYGLRSLNIDLLYGLPYQTQDTLRATLAKVGHLRPDRIALFGYAHVPHMSKRQAMIPGAKLPDGEQRFYAAEMACRHLDALGYNALGIDHFALPSDSLSLAAHAKTMRRNFQ